jgi:hypothetical protein
MLITAAVALLAPGATYVTAGRSSAATATTTPATVADGCRGVTQAFLPANGFITNPEPGSRRPPVVAALGGRQRVHWDRDHVGAVQRGRGQDLAGDRLLGAAPGGLTAASRTFTLKRGWYWWGFGVHQAYQGLSAVCMTATESFGMSCVHFSGPAG